jgi:DNA-binding GntR family transcriptional regulator
LRSLERPGRPESSNQEHRSILAAVRARDAGAAREAMRSHIDHGRLLTTSELDN